MKEGGRRVGMAKDMAIVLLNEKKSDNISPCEKGDDTKERKTIKNCFVRLLFYAIKEIDTQVTTTLRKIKTKTNQAKRQ